MIPIDSKEIFLHETNWVGFLIQLAFHPYVDHRKQSLDASWVINLWQTGPGTRDRLELELLWASASGTRTKLASGLLLNLDTLAGLLPLHTICQTWSYSWVSCPHHPPFLTKSRHRRRLCLKLILHNTKENGFAKTKGTEIIVRRNVTIFPSFLHVISHKNFSKHVDSMI